MTVDPGETKPMLTKSNTANEAVKLYDVFDYVIVVKNGATATSAWKNVTFTDTLPAQVELAGNIMLNNSLASYSMSGKTISIFIGNMVANESVEIKIPVKFMGGVAGEKFLNTAIAEGDNGKATGSDEGITVPEIVEAGDPTESKYIKKDVDKTLINLNNEHATDYDLATFTIEIGNNSNTTWKNVVFEDMIDSSKATVIYDTFYINGAKVNHNNGWTLANDKIVISLGDIEPGAQPTTIQFSLRFRSDCQDGSTYLNTATARGDNYYDTAAAPIITIINDNPGSTDIHKALFKGRSSGNWSKYDNIYIDEVAVVAWRQMVAANLDTSNGTITVPNYIGEQYNSDFYRAIHYMISNGVVPASAFNKTSSPHAATVNYDTVIFATRDNIEDMVRDATGKLTGVSGSTYMNRIDFANLMCDLTGRDKTPDYSAYTGKLTTFLDVPSTEPTVVEVSNDHEYMQSYDRTNEIWVVSDKF